MTIDDEVDEFLEHFGVKGMRWGVRKAPNRSGSSSNKSDKDNADKKKLNPNVKRAAQVAVVAGIVLTGAVLAHRSGVNVSSLRGAGRNSLGVASRMRTRGSNSINLRRAREVSQIAAKQAQAAQFSKRLGERQAASTLRRIGNERFSAIPMPPVRVSTPPRSTTSRSTTRRSNTDFQQDVSALRSTASRLVREANADLRKRDNDLNVPFAQRSYLTEWD